MQITILDDDILYFRFENKDHMQFECTPKIAKALKAISKSLIKVDKDWEEQ